MASNGAGIRLTLSGQPARIAIESDLVVRVSPSENLAVAIDDTVHARVPVEQALAVDITQPIPLAVMLEGNVPIQMNLRVRDELAIDQSLMVDTVLQARVMGVWLRVPVRGEVPIRMRVPVDISVPVNDTARIAGRLPVRAYPREPLHARLNTTIDTDVSIRGRLDATVSPLNATVRTSLDPLAIRIEHADLRVPLTGFGIEPGRAGGLSQARGFQDAAPTARASPSDARCG